MLPGKELEALAAAIKATPEYTLVMQRRKAVTASPLLYRQMQSFERAHARILGLDISVAEADAQLKKLYSDYKAFLESEDIKAYIAATRQYQDMIVRFMRYLNQLLDIGQAL